ncbi:hypothetical protein BJX61DRAFT_493725 [Aspergillus egyptiacus]|nr:hypothetical protein BJX61DRAFT_493725 [Aspergillus egyptiacus]
MLVEKGVLLQAVLQDLIPDLWSMRLMIAHRGITVAIGDPANEVVQEVGLADKVFEGDVVAAVVRMFLDPILVLGPGAVVIVVVVVVVLVVVVVSRSESFRLPALTLTSPPGCARGGCRSKRRIASLLSSVVVVARVRTLSTVVVSSTVTTSALARDRWSFPGGIVPSGGGERRGVKGVWVNGMHDEQVEVEKR